MSALSRELVDLDRKINYNRRGENYKVVLPDEIAQMIDPVNNNTISFLVEQYLSSFYFLDRLDPLKEFLEKYRTLNSPIKHNIVYPHLFHSLAYFSLLGRLAEGGFTLINDIDTKGIYDISAKEEGNPEKPQVQPDFLLFSGGPWTKLKGASICVLGKEAVFDTRTEEIDYYSNDGLGYDLITDRDQVWLKMLGEMLHRNYGLSERVSFGNNSSIKVTYWFPIDNFYRGITDQQTENIRIKRLPFTSAVVGKITRKVISLYGRKNLNQTP